MADIQNDVNAEIAKSIPLTVRVITYAFWTIIGASVFGYLLHAVTHP